MRTRSLSALFTILSSSPRTVPGILSMLNKYLENQLMIVFPGSMAYSLCHVISRTCVWAPTAPGQKNYWKTFLWARYQAKGLILRWLSCLCSPPLVNSWRRNTSRANAGCVFGKYFLKRCIIKQPVLHLRKLSPKGLTHSSSAGREFWSPEGQASTVLSPPSITSALTWVGPPPPADMN